MKLHAEKLLSRRATLLRLGYTDDQIDADAALLRAERREAAIDDLIAAPVAAAQPAPAADEA